MSKNEMKNCRVKAGDSAHCEEWGRGRDGAEKTRLAKKTVRSPNILLAKPIMTIMEGVNEVPVQG